MYRAHFVPLVTLSALVHIPSILGQILVVNVLGLGEDAWSGDTLPVAMLVFFALSIIWYVVIEATMTLAVARHYLGEPADNASIFREVLSRIGAVLNATLGKWLTVTLGLFVFLIPGIYFFAAYFAVPAVVLIEKLPAGRAMRRSNELSKGVKMRILGTLGVAWIVYMMLSGIPGMMHPVIALTVGNLMSVVAYPLIPTAVILLYYDARIRKEGFDLEYMASGLAPAGGDAAVALPATSP